MGQRHPEVPDEEEPTEPVTASHISAADRDRLIEMIDGTERICAAAQAAVPTNTPVPPELLDMLVRMSDTVEEGRRCKAWLQRLVIEDERVGPLDLGRQDDR